MTSEPDSHDTYILPSHRQGDGSRLNQQHEAFRLLLDDKLLMTPLPFDFSGIVLDVGSGTGIWASEFAVEYPFSTVHGIDLFPPSACPVPLMNCSFHVLDAEQDWDPTAIPDNAFELIHTRMLLFLLKNPRAVLEKCFRALKPGGRVEFHEMQHPYRNEDAGEDTLTIRLSKLRDEGAARCGLDRTITSRLPEVLRELGFEDVQAKWHKMPVGPWMESDRMKEAGDKYRECLWLGMVTLSKTALMKGLGWSEQQVVEECEGLEADLGKGRVYAPIRVVLARKPL